MSNVVFSAMYLQNFITVNWSLIIDDYQLIGTSKIYSYKKNEGQT